MALFLKVCLLYTSRKSEMNLPIDYIAVHIRRGDKIVSREMKELGLSLYIDAVKGKKHISRNVFIATDDGSRCV